MTTEVGTITYTTSAGGPTSLPQATSYTEAHEFRASPHTMADGSVKFQYLSTTRKRVITVGWQHLSAANFAIVETFYGLIATDTDGTVTFVTPNKKTLSVTLDPTSYRMSWSTVSVPNGIAGEKAVLYSASLTLREV